MGRELKITLGQLTLEALDAGTVEQLRNQAAHAIRYYLTDKDAGRPGWPYPDFISGNGSETRRELELTLEASVWDSLAEEAARQGVSPEQLAQHAVLYFVADREAGRVPARIRAA
jgi:hypothetical protein